MIEPTHTNPQYNPENTVIAFDLQRVMFYYDFRKLMRMLLAGPKKWRMLGWAFHPGVMWQLLKFLFSRQPFEVFVREVLEPKYPSFPISGIFHAMAACMYPISGTIEIIHELHAQKYELYLFSNIDEERFGYLKAFHPTIFAPFTDCFIRSDKNYMLRKPELALYREFIDDSHLQSKHIIF